MEHHNNLSEYYRGAVPGNELQIYTWYIFPSNNFSSFQTTWGQPPLSYISTGLCHEDVLACTKTLLILIHS